MLKKKKKKKKKKKIKRHQIVMPKSDKLKKKLALNGIFVGGRRLAEFCDSGMWGWPPMENDRISRLNAWVRWRGGCAKVGRG